MFNNNYKGKTVLIWGVGGKTGKSLIDFLQNKGVQIWVGDDNTSVLSSLTFKWIKTLPLSDDEWNIIDGLCVSPGLMPNHPIIEEAKRHGFSYDSIVRPITSDIAIFCSYYAKSKYIIGVTGTNGKSTTTALIQHILDTLPQFYHLKSEMVGNIGIPALAANSNAAISVVEVSSAQAEFLVKPSLKIAILLGLNPQHLERYNMQFSRYVEAKKNLFSNDETIAIVLVDNNTNTEVFLELTNTIKVPCSTKQVNIKGFSLIQKNLYSNSKILGSITDKTLNNIWAENIVVAYAAVNYVANQLGIFYTPNDIIAALATFKPLEHRLENIGRYKNINFINDSKATTTVATNKALTKFNNIYWIAGGKKTPGNNFNDLNIHNIKEAFFIGQAAPELAKLFKNRLSCSTFINLEEAFEAAYKKAVDNLHTSVILLSPACSSLDQWKNFEERGNFFKKLYFTKANS